MREKLSTQVHSELPNNSHIAHKHYNMVSLKNQITTFNFIFIIIHIIHSTDSIQCVLVQHLCHYIISYCSPVLYIIFTLLVYCPRRTACISVSGTTPAPELAVAI